MLDGTIPKRRRLAVKFRALPFAILVLACDGGTHLAGEVRDSAGIPVAEAVVTLAALYNDTVATSAADRTAADGSFSVNIFHSPFASQPLRLTVLKAGYRPYALEFTAGHRPEVPMHLVLAPTQIGTPR
jgi:hypothetical protein